MHAPGTRIKISQQKSRETTKYAGKLGTVIESVPRKGLGRNRDEYWFEIRVLLDDFDDQPRWFHHSQVDPIGWDNEAEQLAGELIKKGEEHGLVFDIFPSGLIDMQFNSGNAYIVYPPFDGGPTLEHMVLSFEYALLREGALT